MGLAVVWTIVCVLMVASCWKVFTKAGEAGWKCLVPIYGAIVFMKIVERPWWWALWMCVPLLGLIPALIVSFDLARVFGKSMAFGVGVALLGPVFMAVLAFSDAEYQGSGGSSPTPLRKAA